MDKDTEIAHLRRQLALYRALLAQATLLIDELKKRQDQDAPAPMKICLLEELKSGR